MGITVFSAAMVIALLVSFGCTAYMHPLESAFFAQFSLSELVEKNKSRSGLDCSAGGGGGGGIAGGGGGLSSKGYQAHKGESLSCRLSGSAGKFDEAGFLAALKQDVERDISESGARIIDSGEPNAGSFYFEYELENGKGRIEVTGKVIRDVYYSLKADLDERGDSESRQPSRTAQGDNGLHPTAK